MNRFYCGAVFALAMNHAGHNLIQHVQAQISVTVPATGPSEFVRCSSDFTNPEGKHYPSSFMDTRTGAAEWLENMRKTSSPGSDDYEKGYRTLFAKCEDADTSAPVWHLLSQSYGGTVSLLKELTEDECEHIKRQLMPEHANGAVWIINPSDIKSAECFK